MKKGAEESNEKQRNGKEKETLQLSRRNFLKLMGASAAAAGLTATGVGCRAPNDALPDTSNLIPVRVPQAVQYPEAPYTPAQIPEPGPLRFFTPHEADTVEAFTARLLPGSPEDPGAREAGVVYYVDRVLAEPEGMPEPVYRDPPFAMTYVGSAPPFPDDERVVWVPDDEIERYGYQSIFTPRETMRMGLSSLDRYSNTEMDNNFVALSEEEQDEVIRRMVDGEVENFEPLDAESFFHVMRRFTSEGMFSDPVYGGNRDLVGWKLIGYPGAQRAYTVSEIQEEGAAGQRPVWSLVDMPHSHPGQDVGENTVMPVSGSAAHEQSHIDE